MERATVTLRRNGPNGPTLNVYDDDDPRHIRALQKAYTKLTCDNFNGVTSGTMQTLLDSERVRFVRI
jgi:hypothetical protein